MAGSKVSCNSASSRLAMVTLVPDLIKSSVKGTHRFSSFDHASIVPFFDEIV
jgi:hypothetical protein